MVLCLMLYPAFIPASENSLSGNIEGALGPGTYRVTGDITVAIGSRLLLRGGTSLCFDGFYSFVVHGSLIAEGTLQNRVVFTSARDKRCGNGSAEPMDWNHLEIAADAGSVNLGNVDVLFSTDGILCAVKTSLLEGVVLEKNGINRVLLDGLELGKTPQGVFQYSAVTTAPVVKAEASPIPEPDKTVRKSRRNYYLAGAVAMAAISGACLYFLMDHKSESEPGTIPDPPPPSRTN